MAKKYPELNEKQINFIQNQHIFFVGTAAEEGRVNISPKGLDSFKVIDANTVIWLNLTGSGNETAAHILRNNRMTIMFCAFSGDPLILRIYGTTNMYHENDEQFKSYLQYFPDYNGARQIFELNIDLVQTSCGFAVPNMEYKSNREILQKWSSKQGEEGIKKYWKKKNTKSIDGFETDIQPS